MTRPTSASQRMASSLAFFSSPFRRFEKVTCRLVVLSILRITIFPLPMIHDYTYSHQMQRINKKNKKERNTDDRSTHKQKTRRRMILLLPDDKKPKRSCSSPGADSKQPSRLLSDSAVAPLGFRTGVRASGAPSELFTPCYQGNMDI
ncbi:hypothetical protein GW17_00048358 [Ensete ventricosum]|nr:hypothetical protein GW17_00048358 [Ensete ventricosum]